MKQFIWNNYNVQITKKKIKRVNLRIKPTEPNTIQISCPYQISYESAFKVLEQPKIQKWLENYERKNSEALSESSDWYEEHRQQEALYQEKLQKLLPGMFEKWENILGVKSNKISIRDTRSQWGSCNTRSHNISISVWLGAYPEECIEYVVVHELVHLLEKGHNAKFYGYLDKYYPNWKECRKILKIKNKW